jgi:hypothetical protein
VGKALNVNSVDHTGWCVLVARRGLGESHEQR